MYKRQDLTYSGGFVVGQGGDVTGVTWGSPAFDAGLTIGTTIVSVNGQSYSDDRLKAAITAAKDNQQPVQLWVKNGDTYRQVALDWRGGLRYPRLEKTGAGETGLDRLLAPR